MKKLLLRANLLLLLTIMLTQLVNSQTFTEHASLSGVANASSAWGDYDNDGDLDILITGSNTSRIYMNDGGTFTDIDAGLFGINQGSAGWGDYDNDGDLDIVLTGSYITVIYRNDSGVFNDISAGLPGLANSTGKWGDYDNDGDLDLFLSGLTDSGDRISRLYRNDNNIFGDCEAGFPGVPFGSAAWGDYDKDGDLDIVISGIIATNQRIARIYRNDNGVFTDINAGLSGFSYGGVAWGDYDNDGDLDLIAAGNNYILKLYRNEGGVFSEVSTGIPGLSSASLAWGDCDNDGDLDLLVSGGDYTGNIFSRIYRNDSGTFSDINAGLPEIYRGSIAWGDFEGDGDLDILLTGLGVSKIYKNGIVTSNTVPTAPSGLTATATGTGMLLSWTKSSDNQTLQTGLTYNLYIGTSSGAVNKRTPMAVLPGGFRKIAQKSEIQSNSWLIKRLPAGTYFWSVQAVDNNFAGSPFATQTTFTVPFFNSVAPAADQIIAVSQTAATLTVTESSTPTSRQWKYSNINGGPYDQLISGATGTTCSPSFNSTGTYYVVCESTKGGVAYFSNQVKITVSTLLAVAGLSLPGIQEGSVEWGDFDKDGDIDLLITGNTQSDGYIARVYRNDAGFFTDISAGLAGVSGGSASWGDYDNDGDLDIVLTGSYISNIYRNDAGAFTDISAGLTGVNDGSVKWGDYDNDGDLDILLSGRTAGNYSISKIYNNRNGVFSDISAGLTAISGGTVSWGDYDNDGDLDVLISGSASEIHRNDNGSFTDVNAGLPSADYGTLGDYDSDGDLDILLSGSFSATVYNNNNGNFVAVSLQFTGVSNSVSAWGDYDNDGDLDIFLSGKSLSGYISKVYLNNNNVFSEVITGITSVYDGSAALGDYDGDNDLDLILTGTSTSGYFTKVYKNYTGIQNGKPSSPANLQAVQGGNKVTFSWDKSLDSKTSQSGLSYALYIGTTPDTFNICSPMTSVPAGYRRIVNKGNQLNSWFIRNLPAGTYYWGVQAIDNSFAGSVFSAESTFTVSYATSVSPVSEQTLVIEQTGTQLTVSESSPADSRQWKYAVKTGGPFDQVIPGATGISYSPVFSEWGTYFVVCESIKSGVAYTSNEVRINVPLFTEIATPDIPGLSSGTVKWGDYDGNGYLDLLVNGYSNVYGYIARIYGNTSGTLTDIGAGLPDAYYISGDWWDYDRDGDLDIILSTYNEIEIYRNDAGVFNDIGAGLANGGGSAKIGDYDNDGDLDILSAGNPSYIHRNDNSVFNTIDAGLVNISESPSGSWGDYDNDGDLDILITGMTAIGAPVSIIYRNNRGTFTALPAGLKGLWYGSSEWGDYDSDGDLDVLLTGYDRDYNTFAIIYRNDNGTFPDINAGLTGVEDGSGTWGDYDNDGDLDILITGYDGVSGTEVSKIYRNDNGIFTCVDVGLPGVSGGSGEWGDYDNDNDLDVIITGGGNSGQSITSIIRNNITSANSAPSPPANLQAVQGSNKVTLSWNKSTDSKTAQNGLSYNVYIGTAPGKIDKKSPMASLTDGYRHIVARGNQNSPWSIKDLPVGTYWWSVQAIDNSFKGSAFASEGTFTVLFTNSVSPAGEQVLGLSQNGTSLTLTESAIPTSRQWKYSITSGGPYNQTVSGATGSSYTPNFAAFGNYYVICESVYGGVSYTSNEVSIRVPYFKEQSGTGLPDIQQGSVSFGNYDTDNDLDILIAGGGSSGVRVFTNTGGVFSGTTAGPSSEIGYSTAAWGDYDSDNDLDILVCGYSSATYTYVTQIYRNDDGTFTDINAGLPGLQNGSAAWGDYDNDGDLDILLSGLNFTKVFRNTGGVFSDLGAGLAGVSSSSCAWGDYDNDEDLDIVLTGLGGTAPISKIYRNDYGEFVDTDSEVTGVSSGSVVWGDYDSDGDLDLLLSGLSATDPVTLIYNNSGGNFTDISAGLPGVCNSSVSWGDFDNDGDLDILITGNNSAVGISRIYRNDGGVFTDIRDGLTGVEYSSGAWGDYDGDGDLDIMLTGWAYSGSFTRLYKNNISTVNSAPSSPANLISSIIGNKVILTWDKSNDSKTSQAGLTYNIYIGTSAGSGNKKSPMSAIPGGTRKIVKKELQTNSYTIRNLPVGTYHWSVQAIDNTFAGSAFASEADFTIDYSTSISPEATQALSINQNGTMLTVTESTPADSRQWKYSEVAGGPYGNIIPGATGTTWTPVFQEWGSYYVVCESGKGSVTYTSNEVRINIPVFLELTGSSLNGTYYSSVAWGDYDNDGDLDLFASGLEYPGYPGTDNHSRIYRNDSGIFTDIQAGITGIMLGSGAWGDFDNDGDLDLIISGYVSSRNYNAKIYRNDSGIFTDINAGLSGLNASVDWGDYDNDGDLDLVISGYNYPSTINMETKVYNNNNGVFTDIGAGLPGIYYGSVRWGDYDNDGVLDILHTGIASEAGNVFLSKIYRNDNGSFTDINAGLTGVGNGSGIWFDYDNDGDLDVLLTGVSSSGPLTALYQNNTGSFSEISSALTQVSTSSASAGDFDNDGDQDILLTGSGSSGPISKVFRNDSGSFTDINASLVGVYSSSIAWGDYDNDGDLDIALAGWNSTEYYLKIYKNSGIIANTPPAAPANLNVTALNLTRVSLSWNKATDSQTTQNALNYNLRVGTSAGGSNIVNPMASVSTGLRKLPSSGNTGFVSSGYVLNNLAPGTYYWSVQAIDQAYAGGAWTDEASFTILTPPVATDGTSISQTSFTANWGASAGATGYRIDVASDAGLNSLLPGYNNEDVGTALNAVVSGLTVNTTYYYRIRPYSGGGTSLITSNVISVTTLVEVPPAPVAQSASSITQTGCTANWAAAATATGYRLDVATDNTFTTFVTGYNNIDVGNVLTKSISGLTANSTYYIRIRAYSAVGTSANSNVVTVTTLPLPPSAPVSISYESITSTGFVLKWRTSPTATTYYLDVSTVSDFASFITGYNDLNNGSDTSKTLTGLSPVTTYYFRARAGNSGGISSSSATGNATTLPEIPAAPVSSAAGSIGQVVFTANWSASTGATGYRLDVSTDATFTTLIPGFDNLDVGNVTNCDVSGLTAKTSYYYRVRAYNISGTSGNSGSITVTTFPNPPAAPSGLTASSCNNLVTISWTANTETDFQKYFIYGGTTANPITRIDSTLSISTVTKTISGLTSGQTWYFRITAVISPGVESQYSTSVSVLVKKGVVPKIKSKFSGAVLVCYNPGDSIASWQWYRGAAAISGATKQYYVTAGAKDSFSVLTTDKNGCQNSSNIINLTGTKSVSVWPNPAEDNFTLKFSSEFTGRTMIMLFNSSGVKVSEYQTDKPDEELECIVPVGHLPDGLYTVEIVIDGEIVEYSRVMVIN